jgi:hypothetical protein
MIQIGRRSLGAIDDTICVDAEKIVADPNYGWLTHPIKYIAAFNRALCNGGASLYSTIKYGNIPSPGDGLPSPLIPPGAPKTKEEILNWNPDSLSLRDAEQFEAWKEETRDAIIKMDQTGEYNPDGSLLPSADFLNKYKYALIAGAVGLFLFIEMKRPRL